jgi:hypothetical protein
MAEPSGRRFKFLLAALALSVGALFYFVEGLKGDKKAAAEVESFLAGTESAQVTFFQLDPKSILTSPRGSSGPYLQSWKIVRDVPLTDPEDVRRIRSLLTSPKTYGKDNYRCFEPGMGLRFKTERRSIEFVLCLDCYHSYAFDNGARLEIDRQRRWSLSRGGADRLMDVYKKYSGAKN